MIGSRSRRVRRQEFVAGYALPAGLDQALLRAYPELESASVALRGLRQWLRLNVAAEKVILGMPSKAVDLLWHEFILDTETYAAFCRRAYGRFLHHVPATSPEMQTSDAEPVALARTYAMACRDEGIQLPKVLDIPVVFSVDSELGLPDGQHWILSCNHEACRAEPPTRCIRHDILPHLPKDLPDQRQPMSGRWAFAKGGGIGAETPYVGGGSSSCAGHSCGGHSGH